MTGGSGISTNQPGPAEIGAGQQDGMPMASYLQSSRSGYYSVIAALPLLGLYEFFLALGGLHTNFPYRNAGDAWMRALLESLEVPPSHATLVMILLLLGAIPVFRRHGNSLEGKYFGYMLGEAAVYSLLLEGLINIALRLIGWGFSGFSIGMVALAMPARISTSQAIALSLGAGLFEEFVFRVLLLGVLLWLTRPFFKNWLAVLISTFLAAFLFSLAHYIGPLSDSFSLNSFLFRWIAGLIFTGLYQWRGFAITAYAHAIYDIRVLVF